MACRRDDVGGLAQVGEPGVDDLGFAARNAAGPTPRRSAPPGQKPSMRTSSHFAPDARPPRTQLRLQEKSWLSSAPAVWAPTPSSAPGQRRPRRLFGGGTPVAQENPLTGAMGKSIRLRRPRKSIALTRRGRTEWTHRSSLLVARIGWRRLRSHRLGCAYRQRPSNGGQTMRLPAFETDRTCATAGQAFSSTGRLSISPAR
jgi:hypothetical protein